MTDFLTIKEASEWASDYLEKDVTPSNIAYLVQYGKISKKGFNGRAVINKQELLQHYRSSKQIQKNWNEKLGDDLNWMLSFSGYKESETTKHVHRLHPYKGKFIPQLVEYFLDGQTDCFKTKCFFKKGDIVLDPFCGSGTTLVQANELGIHAIGVDVSTFNSFISNVKIDRPNLLGIKNHCQDITKNLKMFQKKKNNVAFELHLLEELKKYNAKYFPSPQFKRDVRKGKINEQEYGARKATQFSKTYVRLLEKYKINLKQTHYGNFLDMWLLPVVKDEVEFVFSNIKSIQNQKTKKVLALILSRTIRSCRATTHSDLGTLKAPIKTTYYCKKHGKICKPLFSIASWWQRYCEDAIERFRQFECLRTDTYQKCLSGDSRTINLFSELKKKNKQFGALAKTQKIKGIFSSPPYVGMIDYHEQHAYSYDLFHFKRKDKLEIGPLYKGQGRQARESYIKGVSDVLNNCKKYLKRDYDIFLVANDKHNLYPKIAELAGLKIVQQHKRPVLNRVERNRSAYCETIFHLKAR